MKVTPIIMIVFVTLAVIFLLAQQPVYDLGECRDPGAYKWQYSMDICLQARK